MEPGLLCSKPAVAINYAHAPQWSDQAAALERYWPSATTEGRLPVVVLSVGFWEKTSEVPEVSLPQSTLPAATPITMHYSPLSLDRPRDHGLERLSEVAQEEYQQARSRPWNLPLVRHVPLRSFKGSLPLVVLSIRDSFSIK